jgi:hypothetical protein
MNCNACSDGIGGIEDYAKHNSQEKSWYQHLKAKAEQCKQKGREDGYGHSAAFVVLSDKCTAKDNAFKHGGDDTKRKN